MRDKQIKTPVPPDIVKRVIRDSNVKDPGTASIREIVKLVDDIQNASGIQFVRMEMGVPGLDPPKIGLQAEIEALNSGVASIYPQVDGIQPLKEEASRFVKNFLNVDVRAQGCIATTGSMQGSMAAMMVACRRDKEKNTTLFIDPGFPVQKLQQQVLGIPFESFDVYNFRGPRLKDKLRRYFDKGNISAIIYSNPNNPSWICFTEEELAYIGEVANDYDVIIIEDLAYFAMDFRKDLSKPGVPPFQPTVANYTGNYILLVSCSKAFSYAGQRAAIMVISDVLYPRRFEGLRRFFPGDHFGDSIVYGAIYSLSAGTTHSAQFGINAILKAANEGKYNFVDSVKEYGRRASILKDIFLRNGFRLVYDTDIDQPIADGFYFTVAYPGLSGNELIAELLYYGISAISLDITGSERTEGIRACVSQISDEQFQMLSDRLHCFNHIHSKDL